MDTSTGSQSVLVSIVVTSHNYDAFLTEAIESALSQTWPAVEVIVIDDGSTDGSPDIIRGFGCRIVPVFKECGGQCSCINISLEHAHGDVIMFLDADDVLLPDAAALHVREFATPDTAKSCGYMDVIDQHGTAIGKRIPQRLSQSGNNYREQALRRGLDSIQISFTSGHAWSRAFLEAVLPLPENELMGIDSYLTSIDMLFGPIAFVHQPVTQYRRHTRNMGPIRYRFDIQYMKNRLARKQHRIEFAEQWIAKLGYPLDEKQFRANREWRLILMNHVLWLKNEPHKRTPLLEFLLVPFQNMQRSFFRSLQISSALLAVRVLPCKAALALSQRLLHKP